MTKQKRSTSKSRKPVNEEEDPLADEGEASTTKAVFDQLLKQAVHESNQESRAGRRRKKRADESVEYVSEIHKQRIQKQLEKLRKGEGLRKDEDQTVIANTYDPDDVKGKKSNKRREKEQNDEKDNQKKGHTNFAFENETESPGRKKKTKSMTNEKSESIEEMAPPVVKTKTKKKVNKEPEEEEVVSPRSVDELDEDYSIQKKTTKKKKMKKTAESESEQVMSEDIDKEDQTSKATTKKKKKKQLTAKSESEQAMSEDIDKDEESVKRTTKKKKKTKKSPGSESEQIMSEDGEKEEQHTVHTKKKKKGRKGRESESEQIQSEDADKSADDLDKTGDATRAKTKNVKKKKKKVKEDSEIESETGSPRVVHDEGRVVAVIVHRTDKLKTDFYISHPLVRVHIVDLDTGTHLKKQNKDRAVTSYYEKDNENVDFILPIMTFPFDFKQNKSILPVWEETVVFNENYNFILQDKPNVMVFFEILDFVSMNMAKANYSRNKQEGGWHRIAWAFLKVMGAAGRPNTDRKVRLQLYQPPVRLSAKPGGVEVYQWWKSGQRQTYPSTLYVTLKGIILPPKLDPAARSLFATQAEEGKITYDELQKTVDSRTAQRRDSVRHYNPSLWSRLPGQGCKVPNALYFTLPVSRKGCFVVRFSPDGRSLACACHDKESYPIIIYSIPEGTMKGQMLGHYGLIYDLHWSRDSKMLLSASSDGSARVWDGRHVTQSPLKLLPHPTYVYAAQFHIRVHKVAVTGGYDRVIRVWSLQTTEIHAQLIQELDGHTGHINTLCFDEEGSLLFSGDSTGVIRMWNAYCTDQPSKKGVLKDWTKHGEVNESELAGAPINHIKLHPNGRRLLVHSRDNVVRMIDLRINATMQRYHGALNFREQIHSTISPCGSFVFSGSEDCAAYVWNAEAGDRVASYKELGYKSAVTDVDYHPHDHIVAFCSYSENHPVLVYKYNHEVAQRDAGLETPVMMVSPRRTGRPASPDILPSAAKVMNTERQEGMKTAHTLGRDEFEANTLARLDRVQRKLETVTSTFRSTGIYSDHHPLGIPRTLSPQPTMGTVGQTWGSTFDSSAWYSQLPSDTETMAHLTVGERQPTNLPPSMFSPHAGSSTLQATIQQQQQLASETEYHRSSGWRPGFSALGTQGSLQRPGSPPYGRAPTISVNTQQGKPQFTFQTAPASSSAPSEQLLTVPTMCSPAMPGSQGASAGASWGGQPRAPPRPAPLWKVVALYDYQAQRSDELALARGDIIKVLYKDNENWWMGELPNGQQGFFPANYVTSQAESKGKSDSDAELLDQFTSKTSDTKEEEVDMTDYKERMAAVVSRSGELKIFSASATESDADVGAVKKVRKKKKVKVELDTTISMEDEVVRPQKASVKRKKKKAPIQEESDV